MVFKRSRRRDTYAWRIQVGKTCPPGLLTISSCVSSGWWSYRFDGWFVSDRSERWRRRMLFRFRLPPIEFQPEFISNHDTPTNKFKCELYSGQICRAVIGSQLISLTDSNQKDIEQNLIESLKGLTANQFLSSECRQLLLPMVCAFTYPVCDNDRLSTRSICRRSCDYFQNNACSNLFAYQQQQHSYSHRKWCEWKANWREEQPVLFQCKSYKVFQRVKTFHRPVTIRRVSILIKQSSNDQMVGILSCFVLGATDQ